MGSTQSTWGRQKIRHRFCLPDKMITKKGKSKHMRESHKTDRQRLILKNMELLIINF